MSLSVLPVKHGAMNVVKLFFSVILISNSSNSFFLYDNYFAESPLELYPKAICLYIPIPSPGADLVVFWFAKHNLDVHIFPFGTSLLFMSSSNCCFLTCIQVSQEAGQVVWYSHLLLNFPQFILIHTVKGFGIVNKTGIDFSGTLLLFWWSSGLWQFDLRFLCFF